MDIETLDGWPINRIGALIESKAQGKVYENNKYFKEVLDEIRADLKALVEYLGIEYIPPKTKEISQTFDPKIVPAEIPGACCRRDEITTESSGKPVETAIKTNPTKREVNLNLAAVSIEYLTDKSPDNHKNSRLTARATK